MFGQADKPVLLVTVDPSHTTVRREKIEPMSFTAVVSGCNGLEIEMHPEPEKALSDAEQQLTGPQLAQLIVQVNKTVEFRKQLALQLTGRGIV